MSCNGCRVLRKGCSDTCILRSSLQWIESPEAQGHATVFVAKFFGRAGMISFISAVSESQRPALFQSLLYEACGRTVNPVFGAVGLLWSGNWAVCQAAVETVLKGGSLRPATSCMPAISAKPMHPLGCRSNLFSLTHPSLTSTGSFDRSLKRPLATQSLAESPAIKRAKVSAQPAPDQLHEHLQEASTVTSEAVSFPQERFNGLLCKQTNHELSSLAENIKCDFAENVKCNFVESIKHEDGQTAAPRGQLHAPVPRRVKPQFPCSFSSAMVRDQVCEEQATPRGDVPGTIELDLTLNSHGNLIDAGMWKRGSSPFLRVSSPSEFSVNSEGSVTNSDTAEYSMSCLRTLSTQGPHHVQERNLLHLL